MRRVNTILRLTIIALLAAAEQAWGFRHVHREDSNNSNSHPGRRNNGTFLRSSLQSLARVAERGASKWGDYVTSTKVEMTSMKKSSLLYVSQLHQRIQKIQHNIKDLNVQYINDSADSGLDRRTKPAEEKAVPPPEHFVQEILSYVLASAAAGSAFAAATAGAFVGTFMIALGALATVLISEEGGEIVYSLMGEDGIAVHEYGRNSNAETASGSEYCDFNGEGEAMRINEGEESILAAKNPTILKLDGFVFKELEKCYNGIPMDEKKVDFSEHHFKDVCIAGGNVGDSVHEEKMYNGQESLSVESHDRVACMENDSSNMKLADSIEEKLISTDACDHLTPTIEDVTAKRVEVVWHDGSSYTKIQPTRERRRKQWTVLTDAERDGALLLSESFRVVSSGFGLVADAVRFTGETAAATAAGAAQLTGGAVRVSGWAVGSLGDALTGDSGREANANENLLLSKESDSEMGQTRKRHVAGKSIRLMGDAIEHVADSLLLAGSATERVAFAAAGAAEGSVRILQDSASSLADMFSKEGRRGAKLTELELEPSLIEDDMSSSIAEEGQVAEGPVTTEDTEPEETLINEGTSSDDDTLDLFGWILSWLVENTDVILAETAGIPSLAPEMLGIFVLCFLASIFVLSPTTSEETVPIDQGKLSRRTKENSPREADERPKDISFRGSRHKTSTEVKIIDDQDSHSTLTAESTMKTEPDCERGRQLSTSLANRVIELFFFLLLMPLKVGRILLVWSWNIISSKESLLVVIYILGWIFLSRVSQHRSSIIQRKSELLGYKIAIELIGKSSLSTTESALWLNSILNKLWRVKSGGLEPLISSSAGASLAKTLERPYDKPSAVAHVRVTSLTLGSSPPIISRIELKGVDDNQSVVNMEVDVGMLFHDAILLLDIKPSSLEYRSFPATTISINSLDAKASLILSVKCSPDYPYVSLLNASLVEIPDFNLRIEPQSESGLKGIDFGSFPVISKWIKSSINTALAEYLPPRYISIDILAWLEGNDKIVTSL